VLGEVQVAQQLPQDLLPGAGGHGLVDDVALPGGEEAVAPEDLRICCLVREVRLVRHHDAHQPVAVLEGDQRAGAGLVAGAELELGEEGRVLEGYGEGEPVALWDAGVEVGGVAELGGVRV